MSDTLATFICNVLPALRSSPTMSAGKAAEPAKKAGRALLTFTVGDISVKPSAEEISGWVKAMEAAAAVAEAGSPEKIRATAAKNLYAYAGSLGTDGLRSAAAYKFSEDSGMEVVAADIGVGTGAKGVLAAIGSYFQPGDEILMASPGWPTNFDVFTHGANIVEVDTKGSGLISPDQLKPLFEKHPKAKGILVNTPNNPTGEAYSYEQREAIMKVIKDHAPKGFLVILDNPYGKLVYEGGQVLRSETEKELFGAGRIVEVRSMSKEYGLAGIRVGYAVSKNPEIVAQVGKWNENRGGLTIHEQNIAQAALLFGDGYIARNVADLRAKRDAMIEGVGKLRFAEMKTPPGAIYAWVDFRKLEGKTVPAHRTLAQAAFTIDSPEGVQKFLIEAASIVAVPGTPFYAPKSTLAGEDWHFRICFSGSLDDINQATANLAEAEKDLANGGNPHIKKAVSA